MRFITIAFLVFAAFSTRNEAEKENAKLLQMNRVLVKALKEMQVGKGAVDMNKETEVGAVSLTTEETKNYVLMEDGQCSTPWVETYYVGHIGHGYTVEQAKAECGGIIPAGYGRYGLWLYIEHAKVKFCCATPCQCSGYKNEIGRGGPECNVAGDSQPWCYVQDDAGCSDKTGAWGRKYSYEACK